MIIVSCSAVAIQNGKVLMVKETKSAAKNLWGLPGGKLEENESLLDCVKRETLEEAGVTITNLNLLEVVNKPKSKEGNTVVKFIFTGDIINSSGSSELKTAYFDIEEINKLSINGNIRGKEVSQICQRALFGPHEATISIRD